MTTKKDPVRYGSLDHIAGWIQAYRQSMQEKKIVDDQRNAYDLKWRELNEQAKDIILDEMAAQGAEVGTVNGESVIRASEYKRSGYVVDPGVVRRIQLLDTGDDGDRR